LEVSRRPIESTQYASHEYRAVFGQHGFRQSMSRKGDCWDNAVAESFVATLEHELWATSDFAKRHAPRRALFEFLERPDCACPVWRTVLLDNNFAPA
jgi:transposase InsO family protein